MQPMKSAKAPRRRLLGFGIDLMPPS